VVDEPQYVKKEDGYQEIEHSRDPEPSYPGEETGQDARQYILEKPTPHKRKNHNPEDDCIWASKARIWRDGLQTPNVNIKAD
jgi:hypothetical protein